MKCPACNKELGRVPLLFCPDCFSPVIKEEPVPSSSRPLKSGPNPFSPVLDYIEGKISKDKREIYFRRREGKTLDEIGKEFGLTKARIGQICPHVEKKIAPFASSIFRRLTKDKDYVLYSEITSRVPDKTNSSIILGTMATLLEAEDLPFASVLMKRKEFSHRKKMEEISSGLVGELENIEDKKDEILSAFRSSGYPFFTWEDYRRFLLASGYRFYGKYASSSFLTINEMGVILIEKFFPEGITLTQVDDKECADMDRLRSLLSSEFGLEKEMRNKPLYAAVSREEKLIAIGRSKFMPSASIVVEERVLERIRKEIEAFPEDKIFFCTLFDSMEPWLRENSPIDNHNFLHGVISKYFSSDYTIRRDYLIREGSGSDEASFSDRIVKALEKSGKPLSLNDLRKIFPGFTDPMITLPLSKSRTICLDDKRYSIPQWINLDGREEEAREIFEENIRENGGYSNAAMLHAAFVPAFSTLLDREHLDSPTSVFGLASILLEGKYDFSYPHVSEKGKYDISSFRSLFLDLFPSYSSSVISYSQFVRDAEKIKMKDLTRTQTFRALTSSFLRIDSDRYMRKEEFMEKEGKTVEEMEEYLNKRVGDGYCSFLDFVKYSTLPVSSLVWNEFLLESVSSLTSFDVFRIGAADRRISRIVVAKKGLYSSYPDLVAKTLENCGLNGSDMKEITAFLQSKKLISGHIPNELFSSGVLTEEKNPGDLTGDPEKDN